MARKSTRRSKGLFSRLYSPVGHLILAGKESVNAVGNTAKGVVGTTFVGVDRVGRSVTGHANMAVRDLFSRKNRKGGRKATRKANTRKNRKNRKANTRKNRK